MPLNSLAIQIERHWREYRPKMVVALEKAGQLETALEAAETLTLDAEAEAIQSGMSPDQAREQFRNYWAFLPSEEDVPDLGMDPALWSGPDSKQWSRNGWYAGERVMSWRAANRAHRDKMVARLKQVMSDPSSTGVSHETFLAQQRGYALGATAANDERHSTSQSVAPHRAWRILPAGAALDAEQREDQRRVRAMNWQARPFWQLCWLAAWVTVLMAFVYGGETVSEPLVWDWSPLRLNGPLIGRRLVFVSAVLTTFLLYRVTVRDREL